MATACSTSGAFFNPNGKSICWSGNVTKAGSSTLVLSGTTNYSGDTTISGGTLVFEGDTSGLGGNIINSTQLIFDT